MSNNRFVDLSKKRFERLVVTDMHEIRRSANGHTRRFWQCVCDCGQTLWVAVADLNTGNTKSCGCLPKKKPAKFVDLTGQRFGRLVVQKEYECRRASGRVRTFWRCLCDCGNEIWAQVNTLTSGHTRSCKCLWDSTLPYGDADFNARWNSYRVGARRRKIAWSLTKDEFQTIGSGSCHYCGDVAIERKIRSYLNGGSVFNGIDRIDSTGPYRRDNCVPCCSRCNRLKGDLPYDEFIAWCKLIAERFTNHNAHSLKSCSK